MVPVVVEDAAMRSLLLPNPGRQGRGLFSRRLLPVLSRVSLASIRLSAASKDPVGSLCLHPRSPFSKEMKRISPALLLRLPVGIAGYWVAVAWSRRLLLVAKPMFPIGVMREAWPPFRSAKVGSDGASSLYIDGGFLSLGLILESQAILGRKALTITAALAPDRSGGAMRQEEMGLGSSRENAFGLEPGMGFKWRSAASECRRLAAKSCGGGSGGMEEWAAVAATRVWPSWASNSAVSPVSGLGLGLGLTTRRT